MDQASIMPGRKLTENATTLTPKYHLIFPFSKEGNTCSAKRVTLDPAAKATILNFSGFSATMSNVYNTEPKIKRWNLTALIWYEGKVHISKLKFSPYCISVSHLCTDRASRSDERNRFWTAPGLDLFCDRPARPSWRHIWCHTPHSLGSTGHKGWCFIAALDCK